MELSFSPKTASASSLYAVIQSSTSISVELWMKGKNSCVHLNLWRKRQPIYTGVRGSLAWMLAEHEPPLCLKSNTTYVGGSHGEVSSSFYRLLHGVISIGQYGSFHHHHHHHLLH